MPQDPADEPASVLLQRIRKEKERLVKEGKLKKSALKEAPFSEDEKPFEIPKSWEWCKLGWVGDWGSGATPAKGNPEYYNNGTIPWLRTGELNNGFVYDSEIKVTPKALERCSLRMCNVGDVLIAMYGATIGKVAIAGIELTTNQACCACTPYLIYNKYLLYYLLASKKAFIELGEGGAQPNISREKIVAFPFPLPPLAEQRRIVAKIEELMPLVERYGKAQQALDQLNESLPARLRQSILQEAIQGRLVPQDPKEEPASELLKRIRKEKEQLVKEGKLKKKDLESKPIEEDEIPFEIPESWEWVRYKDIASCELGKTKNPNEPLENLCPYLCSINVYWNRIDLSKLKEMPFAEKEKEKYSIKKGDMLICEGGEAGRTAIWDDDATIVYYQNALHRVRFYSGIDPKFYMYQMHIYKTSGYLHDYINGETIQHFVLSKLQILPVPLPPLSEQKRIVAKVEELFGVMK